MKCLLKPHDVELLDNAHDHLVDEDEFQQDDRTVDQQCSDILLCLDWIISDIVLLIKVVRS